MNSDMHLAFQSAKWRIIQKQLQAADVGFLYRQAMKMTMDPYSNQLPILTVNHRQVLGGMQTANTKYLP